MNVLVVLREDCDRITFMQSGPAEVLRELIGPRLKRTKGQHLSGWVKNGGRLPRGRNACEAAGRPTRQPGSEIPASPFEPQVL